MARDLIPPPSPAGRPPPDPPHEFAEAAYAPATEPARPVPPGDAGAGPPPDSGPAPFRSRFGFIVGALAGIAVAAAALFVILLGGDTSRDPATGVGLADHWSEWLPPSSDVFGGTAAIAEHVQREYRFAKDKQLVSIRGGPMLIPRSGAPAPFSVKLRPDDGTIRDLGSSGVLYTLAGTGEGGKIVGGTPGAARHRLLRREALELALYSFRYLDNITMVVALLPPTDPAASAKLQAKRAKTAKEKAKAKAKAAEDPEVQAVFYRPGDLREQLESPLTRTLAPRKLSAAQVPASEASRIDRLTLGHLFLASFQVEQDGALYLVLDRLGKGA